MKNIYLSFLAFYFTLNASAQFTGNYAASNWSLVRSAGSNGSVNTAAAPTAITITGSNDPLDNGSSEPVNTDFTIVATTAGRWSFSWTYHTNDSDNDPSFDLAGIVINGVFTQLTNNNGGIDQTGMFTAPSVNVGDVIGFRISATDNVLGNATLTIQNFTAPGNVLPLTLTGFTAKPQGDKVLVNWTTADERNLSGFAIERSADGSNYRQIAFIDARNRPGSQSYTIVDESPLTGMSYYRLRTKEQDGTEKYSSVAAVKRGSLINLQVVPNPVKGAVRITINAAKAGTETIEVVDAAGRTLQRRLFEVKAGQQIFILEQPKTKGLYFVRSKDMVASFISE